MYSAVYKSSRQEQIASSVLVRLKDLMISSFSWNLFAIKALARCRFAACAMAAAFTSGHCKHGLGSEGQAGADGEPVAHDMGVGSHDGVKGHVAAGGTDVSIAALTLDEKFVIGELGCDITNAVDCGWLRVTAE